jgi:beta-mannosidase
MNYFSRCFFIICILMSVSSFAHKSPHTLQWRFWHPLKNQWIDLGTHGSVQQALINSGEMKDPYFGMNENDFTWIENHEWEFQAKFYLTEEEYNAEFVDLDFENIDTYAKIYFNDQFLFKSANYHHPYRAAIKSKLMLGYNYVKVVFTSPINAHKDEWNSKQHLPAPNDVAKIAVAPYARKPQYQFGWDWALRMNTIGFQAPVEIKAYNIARVIAKNSITKKVENNNALLRFELSFLDSIPQELIWESKIFGNKTFAFGQTLAREEVLNNAKLWWPAGHGDQYLYNDSWTIKTKSGEIVHQEEIRFGVRTSKLVVAPDQWGTSYIIEVNGKPIFCKGGDYIPQDAIPERIKGQSIVSLLQDMKKSNFNMVRVWGGGYYQPEIFYSTCDELGLMVWQDLMFACATYPSDAAFLENVKEELVYQLPRIASHPSLVLFCGNNEVNVAMKYWGFQIKYLITPAEQNRMDEGYKALFETLAPGIVGGYTSAPYIHTSPLSHWIKQDGFDHGSQHYWGVWHGGEPMINFAKKIGRFNAEYGFQSFPEQSTLESFALPADMDLESEVMKHHQKSYVGNGMILKHAKDLYGKPKDFDEFVYFSQLTQAYAVSMAVSGHRIDNPRCWGTLFWQVNDCWPAPSWSSIDYYGNWKALQYRMRDDFESAAIIDHFDTEGKNSFQFVSDTYENYSTKVKYKVFNLAGNLLFTNEQNIDVAGLMHQKIILADPNKKIDQSKQSIYVQFEWKNAKGEAKMRSFCKTIATEKTTKNVVQLKLLNINLEAKTADLEFENTSFLEDFWLYSTKKGIRFSTNFESYLPGKHCIKITFETVPEGKDFMYQSR